MFVISSGGIIERVTDNEAITKYADTATTEPLSADEEVPFNTLKKGDVIVSKSGTVRQILEITPEVAVCRRTTDQNNSQIERLSRKQYKPDAIAKIIQAN